MTVSLSPAGRAAWRVLLMCVVVPLAGCGDKPPTVEEKVARAAQLEGALRSELGELVDRVEQIRAARLSPTDLTARPLDDDSNAAAVLAGALTDAARLRVMPHLDALLTFERGEPTEAQLEDAALLLRDEADLLALCTEASQMSRCASGVRFENGFFDRYGMLDDATIAAQMHLLSAHVARRNGDRDQMLEQLAHASRWVRWLGQEQRLEARLLAAQLRQQWFRAVALALRSPAPRRDYVAVFDLLLDQVRDWPEDRRSLTGDRAVTLHAYEAIRLGLLDRVVTIDEKKQLEKEGVLELVRAMDQADIDRDELLYLQVMDQAVELAAKPYHQRVDALSEALARAAPNAGEARRAPLATRLFLVGLGDSLEALARDRALAEGWLLTLASAADFDLPPYRVSPLTGRPYEASRDEGGVVMELNDLAAPNPRAAAPLGG